MLSNLLPGRRPWPRVAGPRLSRATAALPTRRAGKPGVVCQKREPAEEPDVAAGRDRESALGWAHVSNQLKGHLHQVLALSQGGGPPDAKMDQLQAWLSEAQLTPGSESDSERSQTETIAELAGEAVGLGSLKVDVKAWLASPAPSGDETDSQMAAALLQRLLQAYHERTGKAFDDEDDGNFGVLHQLAEQALGGSVDRGLLKRLVKAYISLPFQGWA